MDCPIPLDERDHGQKIAIVVVTFKKGLKNP
jgi:hypothetical protein